MKKKIILIISFISIITILVSTFFIINSKTEESLFYDDKIISNSFEYEQPISNESISDNYFYSDSYFKDSSNLENPHLRTFAYALTLSFNPTYKKEKVNYNIDKIFNELNFGDTMYYDLDSFNKDTIGVAIAHKELNDKYELVSVVIRGSGYKDEWISNLDLGKSGNAKGFDDASKIVLSRLKEYISKNNIENYKLLVSGYSRAAAVASLVGVYVNNNLEEYNMDKNNLFVYSFESPKYSESEKKYDNIHNVINKNDIVTYVYPSFWGLNHSGVDEDITSEKSTIMGKYLNLFSNEKIEDLEEVDKQQFIKSFINQFKSSREKYYEAQESIIDLYVFTKSKTNSELTKIIDFFKSIKFDSNIEMLLTVSNLINQNDEMKIKNTYDKLMSSYDKNYSNISSVLKREEYDKLKEDIYNVYLFLQPFIKDEYNASDKFYHILTFAFNIEDIFKEHYFSVNFEQIKNKDNYYKKES